MTCISKNNKIITYLKRINNQKFATSMAPH